MFVPLLSSLKSFLSQPGVLEDVLAGHRRDDSLSEDYCDSSSFAAHPLFSLDPRALMLFVYYDDVEVVNPLGSRTKKHKLALFYYSLGNLHPSNRSSLNSIQLFAVIKSTLLQEYGPNSILKPLMKDVGILETEGLTIFVDGEEHIFRGTIVMVPGDNLASQYLGGYKALNAALRKCRHCLAVEADMKTKFYAEEFQPRTRATHTYHCSTLEGATSRLNTTTFGITCDSLLNTSKFFHITEGHVPDIMHDVLEVKNKVLADVPYKQGFVTIVPTVSEDNMIQTTSWFQEKGVVYKPGGVIVLHVDNVPVFGSIVDLFVLDVDDFHFVCEVLHTECFNPHYHAYQVCKPYKTQYHICKVRHLYDHNCLSKYKLGSYAHSWFVSLKYYLVDKE